MNYLLNLPNEIFQQVLLPYLLIDDIINLDASTILKNNTSKYYIQLQSKLVNTILLGSRKLYLNKDHLSWLVNNQIYIIDVLLGSFLSNNDIIDCMNYNHNVFHYTQYLNSKDYVNVNDVFL